MSTSITPVFSKPIYSNSLVIDTKKILSLIQNKTRKSFNNLNNIDKNKASENLYLLENKNLTFLKNIILNEVKQFANNSLKYTNEFKISTSWATETNEGENCQWHSHNNCFLSGVIYLKTKKNCGGIVFQDFNNRKMNLQVSEYNVFNSIDWTYQVEEGDILIFPSELWHMVQTNKSKSVRNSIAFNVVPTGLIGDITSDSHMYLNYG
tara:strand:+ start:616 stop:1239 length:624 start_codon:yes stop_codon:yes gene_type:complete